MITTQLLDYAQPSQLQVGPDLSELTLGTVGGSWTGDAAAPIFFEGLVERAGALATSMLVLGRVAATRYYVPPGMYAARVADPVLTSTPEGLRLESFSPCAGVYARFDLDASAVEVGTVTSGVTNVDFNEGMRSLLSGVAAGEPLRLSVGTDGLSVNTLDGTSSEAKVTLPERWLRSFAESQVIAAGLELRAEFTVMELRRLVRDLPRTTPTTSVSWVQRVPGSLRLSTREVPGSVGLPGPERLRAIEPLLPHITGVRVFAADGPASFWEFATALGRFTLGFSVHKARGFSGEGGLLEVLSSPVLEAEADAIETELEFDARIDTGRLAAATELDESRVIQSLQGLAAQGLLGYDAFTGGWFHRPLPYDAGLTEKLNPRLAAANSLVAEVVATEDGFAVNGRRVRLDPDTCTCPWYGKHRGDRGPCKHVLAARMWAGGAR